MNVLFWVLVGLAVVYGFVHMTNFLGLIHGGDQRWPKDWGFKP